MLPRLAGWRIGVVSRARLILILILIAPGGNDCQQFLVAALRDVPVALDAHELSGAAIAAIQNRV
jgi:hypothetical protein